ncbi:MAG: hypothetical protein ABMA13_11645 [Chthoniobacteraceae bacterium]
MEYYEVTLERAQATLPVWQTFVPTLKVGTSGVDALESLIDGFEPLVQARVEAQDVYDAAFRAVQSALLKMKLLGTKVPVLMEGHLEEDEALMKDVDDLFRVNPRTEETILKRARMLIPVWTRANTAMAALTPAQPAIVRAIQGVAHTVAMLTSLLNSYTELIKTMKEKQRLLDDTREALRAHDRTCDRLNKRWYAIVKGGEMSEELANALEGIPTEPGTPLPDAVEIDHVTQGGIDGRQALSTYVPGGGGHATLMVLQWTEPGDAEPFMHETPLLAAGNAIGPFEVGAEIALRTKVSNSAGTRTSAPRTITIQEPIT